MWSHRRQIDTHIVTFAYEVERLVVGGEIDALRRVPLEEHLHTQPRCRPGLIDMRNWLQGPPGMIHHDVHNLAGCLAAAIGLCVEGELCPAGSGRHQKWTWQKITQCVQRTNPVRPVI